jgi:prepilin-type N-terminal cleavage/methylation domain-containing protein
MSGSRKHRRSERGETLIELLIAVAILGVAGVAILTGLMMSIRTSVMHRDDATGEVYVRSFAEAIQSSVDSSGYKPCANAASAYAGVTVPDLPAGYTKTVTSVQSWGGSGWVACTGSGIQRLDLRVSKASVNAGPDIDERLTVIIRQPCNGNALAAGADPCA